MSHWGFRVAAALMIMGLYAHVILINAGGPHGNSTSHSSSHSGGHASMSHGGGGNSASRSRSSSPAHISRSHTSPKHTATHTSAKRTATRTTKKQAVARAGAKTTKTKPGTKVTKTKATKTKTKPGAKASAKTSKAAAAKTTAAKAATLTPAKAATLTAAKATAIGVTVSAGGTVIGVGVGTTITINALGRFRGFGPGGCFRRYSSCGLWGFWGGPFGPWWYYPWFNCFYWPASPFFYPGWLGYYYWAGLGMAVVLAENNTVIIDRQSSIPTFFAVYAYDENGLLQQIEAPRPLQEKSLKLYLGERNEGEKLILANNSKALRPTLTDAQAQKLAVIEPKASKRIRKQKEEIHVSELTEEERTALAKTSAERKARDSDLQGLSKTARQTRLEEATGESE